MSFLFDWIHFHSLYLETIAVSRYPFLRLYKFLPLQSIKILPSHPTPTPYPPFPLVCEARGGRRPSLPTLASQSAGEGLGGEEAGRVETPATRPNGAVERWAFIVKNIFYYFSKIGNLDTSNNYVCLYYFMFFSYSYINYRDISFKSICFELAVRIRHYSSNTAMVGFIRNFLSSFSLLLG